MVVEDEIFVATEIEYIVEELGHQPVGIAADTASAFTPCPHADIALVDLNLKDGATGREIGRRLAAQHGLTVLYMTANPSQLGDGVPARWRASEAGCRRRAEGRRPLHRRPPHDKDGIAPRRLRTF